MLNYVFIFSDWIFYWVSLFYLLFGHLYSSGNKNNHILRFEIYMHEVTNIRHQNIKVKVATC